jgi:GNAT superfamily N-acetyltransferase
MDTDYQIVYLDKPDWALVGGGITAYNTEQAGASEECHLCFVLKSPDGETIGGVIGTTYWGWLSLSLLWLKEEFRGRGFGSQLLAAAEEEARKRGAKHVYLDTFSFQAPEFYEKHGYRVYGELPDFPPGHTRFFMKKDL